MVFGFGWFNEKIQGSIGNLDLNDNLIENYWQDFRITKSFVIKMSSNILGWLKGQ